MVLGALNGCFPEAAELRSVLGDELPCDITIGAKLGDDTLSRLLP